MRFSIKLKVLCFSLIMPLICLSQVTVQDTTGEGDRAKRYYAAKDNLKTIPFVVSNARNPSANIIGISAEGKETFKIDDVNNTPINVPYRVLPKVSTQPGMRNTGMDQSFEFNFIPRDTGECTIRIKGYDETRKNSVDGSGERDVILVVTNPTFMDPTLAPPPKAFPNDRYDLEFDIAVKGMTDFSSYKLIYTFKNPAADTIIGSKFSLKKELITRDDIGKRITVKAIYKGKEFYYFDDTGRTATAKPSTYVIPVEKPEPRVTFPQRNQRLPFNEAILFNASYNGNFGSISGLKEADIISVEISNVATGDPLFDRYEMRNEGRFAAYVDQTYMESNPIEEGNFLEVEIKVKVKGASDFKAKVKLVAPRATTE